MHEAPTRSEMGRPSFFPRCATLLTSCYKNTILIKKTFCSHRFIKCKRVVNIICINKMMSLICCSNLCLFGKNRNTCVDINVGETTNTSGLMPSLPFVPAPKGPIFVLYPSPTGKYPCTLPFWLRDFVLVSSNCRLRWQLRSQQSCF